MENLKLIQYEEFLANLGKQINDFIIKNQIHEASNLSSSSKPLNNNLPSKTSLTPSNNSDLITDMYYTPYKDKLEINPQSSSNKIVNNPKMTTIDENDEFPHKLYNDNNNLLVPNRNRTLSVESEDDNDDDHKESYNLSLNPESIEYRNLRNSFISKLNLRKDSTFVKYNADLILENTEFGSDLNLKFPDIVLTNYYGEEESLYENKSHKNKILYFGDSNIVYYFNEQIEKFKNQNVFVYLVLDVADKSDHENFIQQYKYTERKSNIKYLQKDMNNLFYLNCNNEIIKHIYFSGYYFYAVQKILKLVKGDSVV